ncbi:tagaturonate reductase [Algoriphagus sp. H41]|uniref:Tagaturonate reductase n=1 Tax=Algoriphagus oliviformis TaxID=2811231 RepID=A0ABS3C4P9_9BACT|nr:tagaturonate reductase [Algoriphagus oliviformis]MBN7811922.1 tagaturonate reductase [Algoriphagus oliviformis]
MANSDIQILQFGTGNFLRAFLGSMVQDLKNLDKNLNICIIQSTNGSGIDRLAAQGFEYNLLVAGFKDGQKVEAIQKLDNVKDGLKLPDEADKFFAFASSTSVKWLVSNVTEAGMVWKNEGPIEEFAESFPARLTQWLYRRFQTLPQAETVILPCELLPNNGDLLKGFVVDHAKAWNLSEDFLAWLDEKTTFFNSLVDRIVPGFPAHLDLELKDSDPFLVQAEPYALWAIQGPASAKDKLPFLESNSEVILAEDIAGYALRKVRILNAAHTAMTGHGMLNGIETVGEWIGDAQREQFLKAMIAEEIIPTMDLDQAALAKYSEEVLDRFRNPFVSHKLSDISLNSIAKLKSRLLPIVTDFQAKNGQLPSRLSQCLLSMILFYLRNPAKIRDGAEVKGWFEKVSKEASEAENLKLAVSEWLQLDWSADLDAAYTAVFKK